MPFLGAGFLGGPKDGGGIVYPESASNPFNSNSARNNWANNNPQDLIKDTTVVNVGGNNWYLWTGESNPDTVSSSLWMPADLIVQGGQGDKGDPGIDITTAAVNGDGDLIVTLSNGTNINAGRARGEDGDLVYQQLDINTYGNFFATDWANLGTNIYGVTGLGNQFTNAPFPLNAATTYSFECLLVNEANQYSLRVTSMANADFDNAGRDAILSGLTKTAAESVGWKVYAFTSDEGHSDPADGFTLKSGGKVVGINQDGALTIRSSTDTEHNAVDTDANDNIRLGSPGMGLTLRSEQERITVEAAGSDNELAYMTDIPGPTNPEAPSRFAYWVRENEYTLSEEEIQKEILLTVQPETTVGNDRVTTITFPDQATFTNHYYIPGINDVDSGSKPHIESFRFAIWTYYFQTTATKVILRSVGDWIPFVSSESLSEYEGVYLYRESQSVDKPELHTFAFMRPINFNPAVGVNGWAFQNVHPYSWIPLNSQPPTDPPISTLGTVLVDDNEVEHLRTDTSINSTHDLATGETTLSVDPLQVDGNDTVSMVMGTGINADHDPTTNETTLTVDPTNIDLTGYAELDTDVSFSKVTVKNATNPLYESAVNVTNGGNTEVNLVGTTNIRKVDKTTGDVADVMNINGTSGAVDLRTDVTYQGAITDDKAPVTKEYLEAFGRGLGVPAAIDVSGGNTYQQTTAVALFSTVGTDINDVLIQIDPELLEAETIISVPSDSSVTTKNFDVEQSAGEGTTRNVRAGDTWRLRMIVDQGGVNRWFWDRAYPGGGNVVYGLAGRNDIIDDIGVKAFAYAEGMPYHLLLETPTSSRLFHEFPREKTFRFTPISTGREYDNNVVINQANQGVANADLELGQYSDLPLYVIEPNVVVNRDQRAWINFPANMTLDVSAGFYVFGTVSGWCGNNTTDGNVAVYVGGSEDFRSYTQSIGFVLGNTGVFILDGQNLRTAQNSAALQFNIEPGVTHMYRYAFYVDDAGMMTYYIVDLNTGQLSTGTQQCNLASLGSNPKLYISYDRYGNNTAAIAIAETHLVVNSVGNAEGRWNWRN